MDVVITPTTPIAAPRLDAKEYIVNGKPAPRTQAIAGCTFPINQVGLPAVCVPCGFTASGLPIGMQIVARPFDEPTAHRVAYASQQATDWHQRRPPL